MQGKALQSPMKTHSMYTYTYIDENQNRVTKNAETLLEIIEDCERYGIEEAFDESGNDLTQAIKQILVDRFPF